MEEHGVVPDVIDSKPSKGITITFPSNKTVNFGNELTPTEVKDVPTVEWEAELDRYYTLAMVDPDAPSRREPKFREFNHWLVGNILGKNLSTGDVIAEFFSSGPPKGTDLHRYVFLVYQQENKLNFDEPKSGKLSRSHRRSFSVRKFAQKYNLGEPIAGNFYLSQWDSYVDVRSKLVVE